MRLAPGHELYPAALGRLDEPPAIEVSRPLPDARTVAIVGSREPHASSLELARLLAHHLARAGVVVVSGGAVGVDGTAHAAALAAGGGTWVVTCTGRGSVFPKENAELFRAIEASEHGRMIWPFPRRTKKDRTTPRFRNGVLVALADCVVVIQAALQSGSRNAANWARRLGRPLYVVPGAPWDFAFAGSHLEGSLGARPFWSIEHFFELEGLPAPDLEDSISKDATAQLAFPLPIPSRRGVRQTFTDPPRFQLDEASFSEAEKLVFSKLSHLPTQQDKIIQETGLRASSALTALLTLSLKDVVVEGPDGFFRRRNAV